MPSQLSTRIAHLWEDIDPYGFRDGLESGESVEQGLQRLSVYIQGQIDGGKIDGLLKDLAEVEPCLLNYQLEECRAIRAELTLIKE